MLNNWTPWITSNVLTCLLLVETNETRRLKGVTRCIEILDRYLAGQPADGGCEEGPGYWSRAGGSTFDTLELLSLATKDQLNGFTVPKIQEMGRFIYRMQIADDWFVNFADASAKEGGEGSLDLPLRQTHRRHRRMMQLGASIAPRRPGPTAAVTSESSGA